MKEKKRNAAKIFLKMKRCKYCRATENLSIDHKFPVISGGTDDFKNLQVLCRRCNGTKGKIPHGDIMRLFRWFNQINEERVLRGAKPLLKQKKSPL